MHEVIFLERQIKIKNVLEPSGVPPLNTETPIINFPLVYCKQFCPKHPAIFANFSAIPLRLKALLIHCPVSDSMG